MRQKLAGIFLLVILIAPFSAVYLGLLVQKIKVKKAVKQAMIEGIDKEDLVLLSIDKAELEKLRWKYSGEFEYKGRMYDVVEQEQQDGKILFWCWEDHEENRLNRKLRTLVSQRIHHDPFSQQQQQTLIVFYTSLFYSHSPDWISMPTAHLRQGFYPPSWYMSEGLQPPSPPPDRGQASVFT